METVLMAAVLIPLASPGARAARINRNSQELNQWNARHKTMMANYAANGQS
jgi:hypothetical protein